MSSADQQILINFLLHRNRRKLTDIRNRKDLETLVEDFYSQVRKDIVLGKIFNTIIFDWPSHMITITDFWEANLLFTSGYKGNPMKAHMQVDHLTENNLSQSHFDRWLEIWFETVDRLFIGKKAELAKRRAQNMASAIFMYIYKNRTNLHS